MAISLDELKANDVLLKKQDVTLAIDKDLLEKVKPVLIDYVEAGGLSGFLLTSSLPKQGVHDSSVDFINTISSHPVGE